MYERFFKSLTSGIVYDRHMLAQLRDALKFPDRWKPVVLTDDRGNVLPEFTEPKTQVGQTITVRRPKRFDK